ncbi:hypothetical protein G6F70_003418 [Rhizopus microsporus]|uniref:Uncharacterized protein n=2 Tax=Rhizopus TaxID=4842 RepID=A0A367JXB6_RHIAZ|nr:hypothetical protein G6F71_003251 [Rhizopus microsporus]RCH94570.1 hypothetical protein CU097_011483 [Rhizopus azygosporus]KAG1201173.1 hypothetical protein G6F70_003418 [Rhizopus microsporus]KAG1213254.1 hypothetical protein G6F69_003001 [Rhizopus microsporus]KAG1235277.1 hypothetical protein G6F67_002904 [Rhizopus microsporus]
MFGIYFLFSFRGILFACIVAFLLYIIRGYPQWKTDRQEQQQQQQQQQQPAETVKSTEHKQQENNIGNLSIAHYILVSPFAALYILARVIFDTVRFSIYYALWTIERAMPYVDDWLFETVTVSLPTKINQCSQWWEERGGPAFYAYQANFRQHTLPVALQYVENTAIAIYRIGCAIQSLSQETMVAWRKFINAHDWKQLAEDLCEIGYRNIWQPTTAVISRIMHLCRLVYQGAAHLYISVKNDMVWIATVVVPTVYDYCASTRLVQFLQRVIMVSRRALLWVGAQIKDFVLAPTIGRILTWLVKAIDQLLLMLQTHQFQQRLEIMYIFLAPHIVWTLSECCLLGSYLASLLEAAYSQIIYPAYRLYVKHVVPQLSATYHQLRDKVSQYFVTYIYPTWLRVVLYLEKPAAWLYFKIGPLVHTVCKHLFDVIGAYLTQIVEYTHIITSQCLKATLILTHRMYMALQSWLTKQAPLLSSSLQQVSGYLYNLNWQAMTNEVTSIIYAIYQWTTEQGGLVYASFERSLTTWVKEQAKAAKDIKTQ